MEYRSLNFFKDKQNGFWARFITLIKTLCSTLDFFMLDLKNKPSNLTILGSSVNKLA